MRSSADAQANLLVPDYRSRTRAGLDTETIKNSASNVTLANFDLGDDKASDVTPRRPRACPPTPRTRPGAMSTTSPTASTSASGKKRRGPGHDLGRTPRPWRRERITAKEDHRLGRLERVDHATTLWGNCRPTPPMRRPGRPSPTPTTHSGPVIIDSSIATEDWADTYDVVAVCHARGRRRVRQARARPGRRSPTTPSIGPPPARTTGDHDLHLPRRLRDDRQGRGRDDDDLRLHGRGRSDGPEDRCRGPAVPPARSPRRRRRSRLDHSREPGHECL